MHRGSSTHSPGACKWRNVKSGPRKGLSHVSAPYTKIKRPRASRNSRMRMRLLSRTFDIHVMAHSARVAEIPSAQPAREISHPIHE